MEPEKKTTKKMDLLTAVEKIVDLSKGSQLKTEFYRKAARPIKYLMDKMELMGIFIIKKHMNMSLNDDVAVYRQEQRHHPH